MTDESTVLVLTPVKNAAGFLDRYFQLLKDLDYPANRLAIGMLEGDSNDDTLNSCHRHLKQNSSRFRRFGLWKHDFGFQLGAVSRHAAEVQLHRRAVLAKSRNHLLFAALRPDDDWVLWLDVDLIDYAPDTLRRLLAAKKDIVHPDCVRRPGTVGDHNGASSYDLNAWSHRGAKNMHDLRSVGDLVPLDSVGGTMLLVRADRHRDGLVFPCYPYGVENAHVRPLGRNHWHGEIETEGLGMMAGDMGVRCWGMPNLRVVHR